MSSSTPDQSITPAAAAPADAEEESVPVADPPAQAAETPRKRARRHARRTRLQIYAITSVALFAIVIALAASNTARAKVSWIVGSSRVSLVWMVLAAAIIGWLLGLATAGSLHRRTRAPR
jgi:uncharacterized integral membrane protein